MELKLPLGKTELRASRGRRCDADRDDLYGARRRAQASVRDARGGRDAAFPAGGRVSLLLRAVSRAGGRGDRFLRADDLLAHGRLRAGALRPRRVRRDREGPHRRRRQGRHAGIRRGIPLGDRRRGRALAGCVKSAEVVAFPELGAEAVRRLEVAGMPLVVGVDAAGRMFTIWRQRSRKDARYSGCIFASAAKGCPSCGGAMRAAGVWRGWRG